MPPLFLSSTMKLEQAIKQENFRSPTHKAMVNLIYTSNWAAQLQVKFLKPFSLTSQQFNILRILRGQYPAPVNIKVIRERMLDKMSDASRIVEKLRLKGMLERSICSKDRRSVDVVITQKGLDLLQKIDKREQEVDLLFHSLSDDELNQLNHLLDKLRDD